MDSAEVGDGGGQGGDTDVAACPWVGQACRCGRTGVPMPAGDYPAGAEVTAAHPPSTVVEMKVAALARELSDGS